ncbi:MAG: HlyD family efflux transporter periplasmic adaptor subunit [Chitinophagaceae bacterium]|nr:HlyD family efflux transporter periplasmic adaptor subunit [Chitinophagaceae bacterium]
MSTYTETTSYQNIYRVDQSNRLKRFMLWILLAFILILFLPWTQNIRSKGKVTTLRQEQRAQLVNTIIGGRIIKWYVKEGDFVKAGDTIAQLSEIKDDYLDPNLLQRTGEQLDAKEMSVTYYEGKAEATKSQIEALNLAREIKMQQLQTKLSQLRLKIQSDSATYIAAKNDYTIAQKQFQRQQELYNQGLVSLVQLEQRNITLQTSLARQTTAENNLTNSRQEIGIIQLELNGVTQDYNDKINKALGDQMQSMSQKVSGQAEASKLKNQYDNYKIRNGLYYIIAPQEGQIVQAKRSGIGEIIKEGETLVQIVPRQTALAVEIFVKPVDIPLLKTGQKIRFMFDGFPAIVFSGWPEASYGTFGGIVTAIENNVSASGMYRVLVQEDTTDKKWPATLRIGTGAQSIALLKDVPIGYELWRNINGFPPDYYGDEQTKESKPTK